MDTNTGAIATINGNDAGLSMREVAQDVAGNVYIPCGSVAFANLPALSGLRVGSVYDVTDSFTTTSDFLEGAGHVIPAGSNVVVVDSNGMKKWDVFGMPIDTSGFMAKTDPIGTGKLSLNRKTGTAEGNFSTATGKDGTARGYASHAEGYNTIAYADFTHTEGHSTTAYGDYAHAEGYQSNAEKIGSHAEGNGTHALGDYSHVEGAGSETKENGYAAHAEGGGTSARGYYDHAEGMNTIASGGRAHAEGDTTKASGSSAHAEGAHTIANQQAAHAEGYFTIADSNIQHVQGKYNVEDSNGVYADIVGNGTADNDRKNIEATTWTGDKKLKGNVYAGCNDDSSSGDCLARENMIANAFSDTISYAVGDYVIYNNVLYRCTTAHTAGVWVAGHFTQATVGGDLSNIMLTEFKYMNTGDADQLRSFANDKLYSVKVSNVFNVKDNEGTVYQIPLYAEALFYKHVGDLTVQFHSYYGTTGIWEIFYNANGRTYGKKIV